MIEPPRIATRRAVIRGAMVPVCFPHMIGRQRPTSRALIGGHEGPSRRRQGRDLVRFDVSGSGQLRDIVIGAEDQ